MIKNLNQFSQTAADWRQSLRRNRRKTYFVIGVFFLVYIALGLLVDVSLISAHYPRASTSQILDALITLTIFPIATLIMLIIAAISLLVTLAFHDQLMLMGTEYFEVTPTTARNAAEKQLYNIIEEMKIAAGMSYMPRVYLIDADYMNAFASGFSEKSAMVAITRGLMEKLNRAELQAVMAHELSHIRHGDIRLTLMASVLANLMVMILDILFYQAIFANRRDSDRESNHNAIFLIIMLLRYLLPVINIILLLYLSRTREYMADAGSVELVRDNQPLASALLKIQQDHEAKQAEYAAEYQHTPHENVRREAYIFDPAQAGISGTRSFADVFSTHPAIKDRLAAIGFKQRKS